MLHPTLSNHSDAWGAITQYCIVWCVAQIMKAMPRRNDPQISGVLVFEISKSAESLQNV